MTEVITGYVEGLTERAEAYTELTEEEIPEMELEELSTTYGVKEGEEVPNKEIRKMLEKYGLEE